MLQVGIAKVDITPPLGSRLAGYGSGERPAEVIHDPLAATAIVFADGDIHTAHVTLDLAVVEEVDVEQIRKLASEEAGIPRNNINIGVSHTHSGPQTFSFSGWGEKDDAYVSSLIPKAAQAVIDASRRCVPVRVGFATVNTRTGINRRSIWGDSSKITFHGNPFGSYDKTMTVARFEGDDGPVAILVHCSAHCTAMGNNRLVSRDWAGVMIDRVESQTRTPVIFINGAYGDAGPRTNHMVTPEFFSAGSGDGIHAVNEVGYRAASDALYGYASIKYYERTASLRVLTDTVRLPLAPLPPLDEANKQLDAWLPRKDEGGKGTCRYEYWNRVVGAHAAGVTQTHRAFTQTIIGLGPMALVPMPGEAFSSTSLRLRRFSPFPHTLVCGGTNVALCYLPDREARARGGYETWVSIGTLTQLLADHSDDALVDVNLALLQRLHKKHTT